jgi:hypothetical protein
MALEHLREHLRETSGPLTVTRTELHWIIMVQTMPFFYSLENYLDARFKERECPSSTPS